MFVLGLNQHHDSAAALLYEGQIVAFAEEERFTRIKHDGAFPVEAIRYCLREAGITLGDLDHVAYFWQGRREIAFAARHFLRHFPASLDALRAERDELAPKATSLLGTLRNSFTLGKDLRTRLGHGGPTRYRVHLVDHHPAHAASAYYLSGFDSSAILTWDGLGSDGTSTYLATGDGDRIADLRRVKFPHSLGALYASVTTHLGFKPNRDEGKVMGLAAFGTPVHVEAFRSLVRLGDEGRYRLDLSWFRHHTAARFQMSPKFTEAFGPPRPPAYGMVEQHYADLAYALQHTLEEACLHVARYLRRRTGRTRLCTAGGVALNSVMNGRILAETGFEEFFAQPAASDDGSALGAALVVSTRLLGRRTPGPYIYLGPAFGEQEMERALAAAGLTYRKEADIAATAAKALADGKVMGWFQGRMECGPRALGNRSILADPRSPHTKDRLNEKVKHREPFRPFAPACLAERAADYFAGAHPSPVMLLVSDVLEHRRAEVPAITHADGTARVQTVARDDNPAYYDLIARFAELTGVPMVVNTSFNDNDEPIVCTPEDAVRCYLKTDIDALALGPYWTEKA